MGCWSCHLSCCIAISVSGHCCSMRQVGERWCQHPKTYIHIPPLPLCTWVAFPSLSFPVCKMGNTDHPYFMGCWEEQEHTWVSEGRGKPTVASGKFSFPCSLSPVLPPQSPWLEHHCLLSAPSGRNADIFEPCFFSFFFFKDSAFRAFHWLAPCSHATSSEGRGGLPFWCCHPLLWHTIATLLPHCFLSSLIVIMFIYLFQSLLPVFPSRARTSRIFVHCWLPAPRRLGT